MIRTFTLSATVLASLLALPAAAELQAPADAGPPAIVTSGEGVLRVAPDQAFIGVTAESRARNPREAQAQAAAAMRAVQERLRAAGLAPDALRTLAYTVQAEYDYPGGRRVLREYVARNTIEVRVDDLDRVGEILDLAVTAGATSIGGIRFDVSRRAGIEREVLRLAVADARARAEAIAEGAGRSLDRILRIDDHRSAVAPPQPFMRTAQMEAADAPPVAPGEIEIRAHVTLTVAIR